MKIAGEVTFELESKADLKEFFSKANFTYLTNLNGGLTQIGSYGDVRPVMQIMEFLLDELEPVVGLRSQDPDLFSEFKKLTERMNAKQAQFERTDRILEKAEKEGI